MILLSVLWDVLEIWEMRYYCWRRGHSTANNRFGVVYKRCGDTWFLRNVWFLAVTPIFSDIAIGPVSSSHPVSKICSLDGWTILDRFVDLLPPVVFRWVAKNCAMSLAMIWITSFSSSNKDVLTNKRNIVTATIGTCFLICREDVKHPRYVTTEPGEHNFGGWRTQKREATMLEMVELDGKFFWLLVIPLQVFLPMFFRCTSFYTLFFQMFFFDFFSETHKVFYC